MSNYKYSNSVIATAIERSLAGESHVQVAQSIGVARNTVGFWLKKHYFFRGDAIITKSSSINNPELEKVA